MKTRSAAALARLAESLPRCDMMNLGYALLIEGPLGASALRRAIAEVLAADPLLAGPWLWRDGDAAREDFAFVAAEHLATPLDPGSPVRAALWSSSPSSHLFLLAIHHLVADGVVLDRLATDLTRRLQGKELSPVELAPQRTLVAPQPFTAPRLPLAPAPPSVRASCRAASLPDESGNRFHNTMRAWRTTPFAGAVTSVVAAIAGWTGQTEIGITIQISGRNSTAAMRAPGPWYDHANLTFPVTPGEPLRALLLDVGERIVRNLTADGLWVAARHEEPCPEVLVVYDRFPLAGVSIPGCRVTPLGVQRQPKRVDGPREYLVATEADIVVFFREQGRTIGMSLFTKTARVPETTAELLFDAIRDALHALSADDQQWLDRIDVPPARPAQTPPAIWGNPHLCKAPIVDAVSPVFRVRDDTLAAFARDAERTLHEWGMPPWQRAS